MTFAGVRVGVPDWPGQRLPASTEETHNGRTRHATRERVLRVVGAAPAVLTPEFEALLSLATRVINDHVDDDGLCAVCGSAFPCERAVLAEHNLDLF